MIGKRIADYDGPGYVLQPGEYCRVMGMWHACCPNGFLANLCGHEVQEHEDGTITARPSILCSDGSVSWHGFLERGIWREC